MTMDPADEVAPVITIHKLVEISASVSVTKGTPCQN